MATVNLPTTLPVLDYEDLVGDVYYDDEPLDTIFRIGDYLYGNHCPALMNIAPVNTISTTSLSWCWPATPSADALTYDLDWFVAASLTSRTFQITLEYSASNTTGAWTRVPGFPISQAAGLVYEGWWSSLAGATATATLPAAARFWKLTLTTVSGIVNVQCQAMIATPTILASTTSGAKASGFIAHGAANTMLNAAGGTIHTEFWNRAKKNVDSVLADREQMLFSYVDTFTTATYTHSWATGRSDRRALTVFDGKTSLPGQGGGPGRGATITVRARVADAAGGGNGTLIVGEVGGARVELDCDDTDVSDTLELQSDTPELYAYVQPYETGSACSVRYVTGHWTLGD